MWPSIHIDPCTLTSLTTHHRGLHLDVQYCHTWHRLTWIEDCLLTAVKPPLTLNHTIETDLIIQHPAVWQPSSESQSINCFQTCQGWCLADLQAMKCTATSNHLSPSSTATSNHLSPSSTATSNHLSPSPTATSNHLSPTPLSYTLATITDLAMQICNTYRLSTICLKNITKTQHYLTTITLQKTLRTPHIVTYRIFWFLLCFHQFLQ